MLDVKFNPWSKEALDGGVHLFRCQRLHWRSEFGKGSPSIAYERSIEQMQQRRWGKRIEHFLGLAVYSSLAVNEKTVNTKQIKGWSHFNSPIFFGGQMVPIGEHSELSFLLGALHCSDTGAGTVCYEPERWRLAGWWPGRCRVSCELCNLNYRLTWWISAHRDHLGSLLVRDRDT